MLHYIFSILKRDIDFDNRIPSIGNKHKIIKSSDTLEDTEKTEDIIVLKTMHPP